MQQDKMVVSEGLTNSEKRREVKGKGEKERYTHPQRVPKNKKER